MNKPSATEDPKRFIKKVYVKDFCYEIHDDEFDINHPVDEDEEDDIELFSIEEVEPNYIQASSNADTYTKGIPVPDTTYIEGYAEDGRVLFRFPSTMCLLYYGYKK